MNSNFMVNILMIFCWCFSNHGSVHFISPGLMMRLWAIMIGNSREDNFARGSLAFYPKTADKCGQNGQLFQMKRIAKIEDFSLLARCGAVQNRSLRGSRRSNFLNRGILQGLKPGFLISPLRPD